VSSTSAPRALLDELDQSLRAEIGARSFYPLLAGRVRDAELAELLASFAHEQVEQVARLGAVVTALGGRARVACWRRSVLARVLYAATWLGATKLALRLCLDAEQRLAHGYEHFVHDCATLGHAREAHELRALAQTKHGHAHALQAWVRS
jgi:hypothetical protein